MLAGSHLFLIPPHMDASATRAQKWKPEPDAAASRNPLKSIQPPAQRKPESPAPTPSKLPFWTPEKAGVPYVCQGTPVLFGPATVLSSVDVLLLELWEDSSFWTNNNVQGATFAVAWSKVIDSSGNMMQGVHNVQVTDWLDTD